MDPFEAAAQRCKARAAWPIVRFVIQTGSPSSIVFRSPHGRHDAHWVACGARPPCDTPAMADALCGECSKPILSTDDTSTVQQVDACTMAVEYVTYHSTCLGRKTGKEA